MSTTKIALRHKAKIDEINKRMKDLSAAEFDSLVDELKTIESEYKSVLQKEIFNALPDTHEAIIRHDFQTISHSKVKDDDGIVTGLEECSKTCQIDLKSYCDFKGFDTAWYHELQAFNKRLVLRKGLELGWSTKEVKALNDSYSMSKLAEAVDLGQTPHSDTQCIKHMQRILDMLDPGCGKINGHDLAFILSCQTSKGKKALSVSCVKHTALNKLMGDVFYRVATGGEYEVEYKTKKTVVTAAAEDSKPKTSKKSTKKAKKSDDIVVVEPETAVA